MRTYWILFDIETIFGYPIGIGLGCGVTAQNREEALALIKKKIFNKSPMPAIKSIKEDFDTEQVEQNHVKWNMGNPEKEGIWYPLGY